MYTIELYETPNGKIPVDEFIDEQDAKTKKKIYNDFDYLKNFGPRASEPKVKFLTDGIFELRINQGKYIRILYFFCAGQRIVMTNGFVKKTNKTPSDEIEKAKRYRADYMERRE